MRFRALGALSLCLGLSAMNPLVARAGSAEVLPVQAFESAPGLGGPGADAVFAPGEGALPAPAFAGGLQVRPPALQTLPRLTQPLIHGGPTRTFPGVQLPLFPAGRAR